MQTLYCYHISPIDHWPCTRTAKQRLQDVHEDGVPYWVAQEGAKLGALLAAATEAFRTIGWEGDYREPPVFFAVPSCEVEMHLGVAVKQDNNGSTFIASPFPMPWLEQDFDGGERYRTTISYEIPYIRWPYHGEDQSDEGDPPA
jgi:hypothetical protein